MKISITAVLCGLLSATAFGADPSTSGTITTIRTYSVNHSETASHGVTLIKLSQALQGGCSWAYIDASDKASLAVALAAKSTQAPTLIWYDPNIAAPWDPAVCALTGIETT